VRQHLEMIYAAKFWGTVYCGPRDDSTNLFYGLGVCIERNLYRYD
jgi:hypothetical protein